MQLFLPVRLLRLRRELPRNCGLERRKLRAELRKLDPSPAQRLSCVRVPLAQQAQQEMFHADMPVPEPLAFFCPVGEHALALLIERKVSRCANPGRGFGRTDLRL